MKKLKATLVGAGNRGCVYADYSLDEPTELEIVAVVEPLALRRKEAGERYHIPQERRFDTVEAFLAADIACDFVINATMDEWHYTTAKPLLAAGYHMLLEKPIVSKREELLELQELVRKNDLKVNVCHVLRYTPFFKRVKQLINDDVIGRIMTMEMNEHVWIAHFIDSYVRGKWNSEAKCGSGFLLAKSCHDMDLACWLNNATKPVRVTSIGSRSQFIQENAPESATDFCYQCPHNDTCLYSAQKIHIEFDSLPFQTWMGLNKPLDEITRAEKEDYLTWSDYGRCAYNSGGDINDRQTVNIEFENGSIASFTMVGGSCKAGRYMHIVGTKGEIEGYLEDGKFTLRTFDRSPGNFTFHEDVIDISSEVHSGAAFGGHAGGDYAIMHEMVRYFSGEECSVSISSIDDSINSHLVVYAAEESVKTHRCVDI